MPYPSGLPLRVPVDNRGLNYDKFFTEGEAEPNVLSAINSNNTKLLIVEETKAKIAALEYIQYELDGVINLAK